jgi:hypothetical protein
MNTFLVIYSWNTSKDVFVQSRLFESYLFRFVAAIKYTCTKVPELYFLKQLSDIPALVVDMYSGSLSWLLDLAVTVRIYLNWLYFMFCYIKSFPVGPARENS